MIDFINCFTVPAGQEDKFISLWKQANQHMQQQPGYVSHKLYKSLQPDAHFRFINHAQWESFDAWKSAHSSEFRAMVSGPEWQAFTSTPALYDVADQTA